MWVWWVSILYSTPSREREGQTLDTFHSCPSATRIPPCNMGHQSVMRPALLKSSTRVRMALMFSGSMVATKSMPKMEPSYVLPVRANRLRRSARYWPFSRALSDSLAILEPRKPPPWMVGGALHPFWALKRRIETWR